MSPKVKIVGKTDKGLVRPANEDFLHIDTDSLVVAVCDGMGGHQAGEVASMTAADTLLQVFAHHHEGLLADPNLKLDRTLPASADLLIKAVRIANRAINNLAYGRKDLAGMGTTIVAVAFESDLLSVAHVGDSRAYRLGSTGLEPLTQDHSWVTEVQIAKGISRDEAAAFVGKNVITRALGVRENVEVDFRMLRVNVGDIFILCSDGLCGYAEDEEIYRAIDGCRGDLDKMVDQLVQVAMDKGGPDNVTVAVIEILETSRTQLPEVEPYTVTFEPAEVQQAEDKWIEKMNAPESDDTEAKKKSSQAPVDSAPPNKTFMILLFVGFFVIAAIIIFLSQTK